MVNGHYWCPRLGEKWLLCGPKIANCKIGGLIGCNERPYAVIGRISHVSHHLGSLLGAMELHVLYAFVCKVGYFMYKLGRLYRTGRGFDLFTSLGKCNHMFLENKIMKELTSGTIPLLYLWEILHKFQATLFGRISLFSLFSMSTLPRLHLYFTKVWYTKDDQHLSILPSIGHCQFIMNIYGIPSTNDPKLNNMNHIYWRFTLFWIFITTLSKYIILYIYIVIVIWMNEDNKCLRFTFDTRWFAWIKKSQPICKVNLIAHINVAWRTHPRIKVLDYMHESKHSQVASSH